MYFQIFHEDISSFVPNNDLPSYLVSMGKDGTWGDHIVLVALAHALGRTIRVVTSLETDCHEIVVEAENQEGEPLLLGHLSENHYVSLELMGGGAANFQGMPIIIILNNNNNNYYYYRRSLRIKGFH